MFCYDCKKSVLRCSQRGKDIYDGGYWFSKMLNLQTLLTTEYHNHPLPILVGKMSVLGVSEEKDTLCNPFRHDYELKGEKVTAIRTGNHHEGLEAEL